MSDAPITPLAIGPRNCERALGVSWRWARDFARRAGVPIWRNDGKTMIPAGPLLAELERAGLRSTPTAEPAPLDAHAELARRIGA